LANLTTYYWLAPYFLVCVGILRIIRRERARDVATVSAASLSMAAIVYVAIEMFRSPIDAGTTYLPYFAVASITAVALTFLVTRRDATASESEAERL
jgi:amino acid transporter